MASVGVITMPVGVAVLVGGAHTSSVPTRPTLRTPTPSLMRADHPVSGRRLITRIFVHTENPVRLFLGAAHHPPTAETKLQSVGKS